MTIPITDNRKALVSIYVRGEDLENRDSSTRYAAKELRYYLGRITAASFEIKDSATAKGAR